MQAEGRHREIEHGDLQLNFDNSFDQDSRRTLRTDSARFGAHIKPSPNSDLIGSVIYQDEREQEDFPSTTVNNEEYIAESQYLWAIPQGRVLLGGGYTRVDGDIDKVLETDVWHRNAYIYTYFPLPKSLHWTLGVSFDSLTDDDLGSITQTNPKIGLTWDVTATTTLRVAGFRTLKRPLISDQTIEPTQVAGFNQLFDDAGGTEALRYGIAIDHRFSRYFYGGIEVSQRAIKVPIAAGDIVRKDDWEENVYRAYAQWTPHSRWALSAGWQLERFEADLLVPDTRTHSVPLSVRYFSDNGVFGQIGVTYVNQSLEASGSSLDGTERFTLVDAAIGYRLPSRFGILRFGVRNLFNEDFSYQSLGARTEKDEQPPFLPERTLLAQILLSF